MTIKTIEQYRASIKTSIKKRKRLSVSQSMEIKYYIAGFIGAATAASNQETKIKKNGHGTK